MRYKVGSKVRIKSLDWYNENKDEYGNIDCGNVVFLKSMQRFCGRIVTIIDVNEVQNIYTTVLKKDYLSIENHAAEVMQLNGEMIEGLVEEETNDCEKCGLTRNSTRCLFMDKCINNKQKNIIEVPEDYVLKDENGNVINATKIVLEKKEEEKGDKAKAPNLIGEDYSGKRFGYKVPNGYEFDCIKNNEIILKPKQPQYPKTYEECCKVLDVCSGETLQYRDSTLSNDYEFNLYTLLENFRKLLICRDAYWKIAGEEMGLDKPWEPDWNNISDKYCIYFVSGDAWLEKCQTRQCPFAFPTAEMRDAFYEVFREEIEICKELL